MADLAQLDLEIRSQSVADATTRLAQLAQQGAKTEQQVGGSANRMGAAFGALRPLIAGALAAFSVSAIVREISEAERANAQLEAVLKSTGQQAGITAEQVRGLADELQRTTTVSDDAVVSMASVLLQFDKVTGPVFERASRLVVDLSTRMGTDLKTAAIQVGKALQDPAEGLGMLSRAGIVFSDEQKKVIQYLMDTNRQAEAQAIILEELEKKFGGAGEAAGKTLGGALTQLKHSFSDLLEGKGTAPELTESIQDLTAALNDPNVRAGFSFVIDMLTQMLGLVIKLIGVIPKLGSAIADMATSAGNFIDKVGTPEEWMPRVSAGPGGMFGMGAPGGAVSAPSIARPVPIAQPTVTVGSASAATTAYAKAAAELKSLEEAQAAVNREVAEYDEWLDSNLPKMAEAHQEYQNIRAAVEAALPAQEQLNNAIKVYDDWLKRGLIDEKEHILLVERAEQTHKAAADKMTVYWEQAARNIQDALANFLINPFKHGLKGMLQAFIQILQQMVAQAAAAKILQAIFGSGAGGGSGLGGFLGSLFSGLFTGGATVSATSGFTPASQLGPPYASGGYTGDGPSWQTAGTVHKGEYVMPAGATQRIGLSALEAMRNGNGGGPGVTIGPGGVVIQIAPGATKPEILEAAAALKRELSEMNASDAQRRVRGRYVRTGSSNE